MLQNLQFGLSGYMPAIARTGVFRSLATFQAPDQVQGSTGNLIGTYTTVAGLANIPCMDAPPSIARVQATEVKAISEIMSKGLRHMLLDRCFTDAPNWSGKGYRCIVDGVTYDLLGAENDSQGTQTRVDLQLVTL